MNCLSLLLDFNLHNFKAPSRYSINVYWMNPYSVSKWIDRISEFLSYELLWVSIAKLCSYSSSDSCTLNIFCKFDRWAKAVLICISGIIIKIEHFQIFTSHFILFPAKCLLCLLFIFSWDFRLLSVEKNRTSSDPLVNESYPWQKAAESDWGTLTTAYIIYEIASYTINFL